MRRFLFLVLASGLGAGTAAAIPVTWTLQGVTFNDGGTASGSFVYDADTNTYSSIIITTTAGTIVTTPATYQFLDPDSSSTSTFLAAVVTATGDLTGVRLLTISSGTLSNSGGTVDIGNITEGACTNSGCTAGTTQRDGDGSLNGPAASLSAVPALSTWG